MSLIAVVCLCACLVPAAPNPGGPARQAAVIVTDPDASLVETFAAREIRRILYVRTGSLVEITDSLPDTGDAIVVARKDRAVARDLGLDAAKLGGEDYLLRTVVRDGRKALAVTGGGDAGTLYAAYRLAERFGVRFSLEGDIFPEGRIPLALPDLDETAKPLFARRGIQPFHDFPEGPDWWNLDDYRAVIAQLPKLRMNFIGLHTYPEPSAEPTVWIGRDEDIGAGANVTFAYPASYQNTLRGDWGYEAKRTSEFLFGAADLFDRDAYSSEVMLGLCPSPDAPEDCNKLFNRTAALLRDAFQYARLLGVQTCVGTETPLTIPQRVRDRLTALGQDPNDPATVRSLYKGMFERISRAYPLDFYWLWTPEGWTWGSAATDQIDRTLADIALAYETLREADVKFRLATCGWVLGPQTDRALFDKKLPEDIALSCINRQVGMDPVEPAFADVKRKEKWAIPWLEDDPALTSPQLWVGRMRRDAADALHYGCTGLMGIHWRTRNVGPMASALAQAAWDQSAWIGEGHNRSGPVGGGVAKFPNSSIGGTEDDPLYNTVRWGLASYRIYVPNGRYKVTLKFCEPHFDNPGQRVFGVSLQGGNVIERLDLIEKVGKNRAFDYTFDATVDVGRIDIDFVQIVENPLIAAIEVTGPETVRINCGGEAYKDYIADPEPAQSGYPAADFWLDWATAQFGPEVAKEAGALFDRIDGRLPRPTTWYGGPGGMPPDSRPWEEVEKQYAFVNELAALGPRVKGAGSRARFDYWLETFRYMRSAAKVACRAGEFDAAMNRSSEEALGVYRSLVAAIEEAYGHLLATVSTTGELGTIANWERHILPDILERRGKALREALGRDLPADAVPRKEYRGPPRIIVPVVRASLRAGEPMNLRVLILSEKEPVRRGVYWRILGDPEFARTPLGPVDRRVFTATFPPKGTLREGLEYYIEVEFENGEKLRWPAGAPDTNVTLGIIP